MKVLLLLFIVGFVSFWGGFSLGIEYEHKRNKDKLD